MKSFLHHILSFRLAVFHIPSLTIDHVFFSSFFCFNLSSAAASHSHHSPSFHRAKTIMPPPLPALLPPPPPPSLIIHTLILHLFLILPAYSPFHSHNYSTTSSTFLNNRPISLPPPPLSFPFHSQTSTPFLSPFSCRISSLSFHPHTFSTSLPCHSFLSTTDPLVPLLHYRYIHSPSSKSFPTSPHCLPSIYPTVLSPHTSPLLVGTPFFHQ